MIARRLAPLALVALLAAGCGDNGKKSATPSTTTTTSKLSTGPSGTTPIPAQPSTKGNRLLLGERDLYPMLAGDLTRYVPNQVRGRSVKIVQVATSDTFWAGRSAKQRILVKLNLKGKTPPQVRAGRKVDFVGHLAPAQPDHMTGLAGNEKSGNAVLENQGVYVLVSVGDLNLH